jgi:hypothetical protein
MRTEISHTRRLERAITNVRATRNVRETEEQRPDPTTLLTSLHSSVTINLSLENSVVLHLVPYLVLHQVRYHSTSGTPYLPKLLLISCPSSFHKSLLTSDISSHIRCLFSHPMSLLTSDVSSHIRCLQYIFHKSET